MTARKGARRSIRDRGRARRPHRTFYDLVVGDGDLAGLSAAVVKAEGALAATRVVRLEDEAKKLDLLAEAERLRDEAVAELEAHRDRIWFQAISEVEYERLRLAHPMPAEDELAPGELWSFIPALIAACAVDVDSTAEEWAEELAGWSRAEKEAITDAVSRANLQPAATVLGKG